jgi:hypothetical protein
MSCSLCSSLNEAEFAAEMMIHVSGLKHLDNPGVLAFPKIVVCLDCGASRFSTPEEVLRQVQQEEIALPAAA